MTSNTAFSAPRCDGLNQFVYILSAGGRVKIGRARDVPRRIKAIQVGCPFEIEPVLAWGRIDPPTAAGIESGIHGMMRATRSYGEWFSCTEEQAVSLLASICGSFVGVSFIVFDNLHAETVKRCLDRERRCRGRETAAREEARREVDSLLSCFRQGGEKFGDRKKSAGRRVHNPSEVAIKLPQPDDPFAGLFGAIK